MNCVPKIAGLSILVLSIGFAAQKNSKPPKNPPPERPAAGAANHNPSAGGAGRGAAPNKAGNANAPKMYMPLNPVQRFLNMTPEEQQRVMEKAPPAQRARLQDALDRWNARPEPQKQMAYRMYQSLSKLPPQQQALVQRQMQAFNNLPEDRIKPVRQELIRLLRMPADQRPSRFSSPEFNQKYSPPEQQILKDLSTTLPDDYPLAGR
jgi:Protein of unknown function (DUF3106)